MIKPPVLRHGDRIAALSLSWGGPSIFPDRYKAGKRQIEQCFGVKLVEGRHTMADATWLAAHPEARASDLMEAFADPSIRGIVSTIGGDDSIRHLPFLDLALIRDNPKPFLGYSDSTVIHFACSKAGLVSFYGPSIMAGFGRTEACSPTWFLPFAKISFARKLLDRLHQILMDGPVSVSSGPSPNFKVRAASFIPVRVGAGFRELEFTGAD